MNQTTDTSTPKSNPQAPSAKQDSLIVQMLFNIVFPYVILVFLKKDSFFGVFLSELVGDGKSFNKFTFILALAFPIGYGCKDFFSRQKINFFSILGTVNIALTGGMGLLEFPPEQIAIKEAAVPGLLGLAILISIKTPFPLVKSIIYNEQIMNVKEIERQLAQRNNKLAFEKSLTVSTLIIAGSSFLAATTNYFLAIFILKSIPGTEEFNDELARMIALSIPVNAMPALVVSMFGFYYTYRNIRKYTGLGFEEILNLPVEEKKDKA